nr:retrovirus-related Pol polyprotein from transposon TNT 1-94 [Tanacetum cinerariifolium]
MRVSSVWATRFATTNYLAFRFVNDKVTAGGYRQVKVLEFFDCLGPRQGVEDLRELLHKGAQGGREAEVFQVSNDDTAVVQRRLEDKQPEEKTNTDCLVKEQEKEYQTGWKIKTVNVLDFFNQRSTQQCTKSGVAKYLDVAVIQHQNRLVKETNVTLLAKALLTTEAGYMTFTEAVKEAIWLKGLLEDLGMELNRVTVNCDNQGTIHLSRNHVFHERTKHINVRYHFIREVLDAKTVEVLKVGTEHNVADALTKVVPGHKLQHCLELLSVDIG